MRSMVSAVGIPRLQAGEDVNILPAPLQSHIKTANQARAVIGRLEYALQHDRREDAHALAIRARQLIGEIIDATK